MPRCTPLLIPAWGWLELPPCCRFVDCFRSVLQFLSLSSSPVIFLCKLMTFHSGERWFLSLHLVCAYPRVSFRGYPEAPLKSLRDRSLF